MGRDDAVAVEGSGPSTYKGGRGFSVPHGDGRSRAPVLGMGHVITLFLARGQSAHLVPGQ